MGTETQARDERIGKCQQSLLHKATPFESWRQRYPRRLDVSTHFLGAPRISSLHIRGSILRYLAAIVLAPTS